MKDSVVLKIITSGDGGVGKTTLLHRYVEDKFLTDTKMTIGVDFSIKELIVNNIAVTLQLWDFTGQEHLRFMLERYTYGSNGALYMFDLNNIRRSLRNTDIWYSILRKAGEIPILLIGTKLDLIEDGNSKSYSLFKSHIDEVRAKYDFVDYIETSSKSGENVDRAFKILVGTILENEDYREYNRE